MLAQDFWAKPPPALYCPTYAEYPSWPHAEGSHNGSAAVLKTAGRKAMQVRVLSPPPLFHQLTAEYLIALTVSSSELARSYALLSIETTVDDTTNEARCVLNGHDGKQCENNRDE